MQRADAAVVVDRAGGGAGLMSVQPAGPAQLGAPVQADPVETARVLLARAMLRGAAPIESIQFTAPCPACGRW
jgi:hypothetical protein